MAIISGRGGPQESFRSPLLQLSRKFRLLCNYNIWQCRNTGCQRIWGRSGPHSQSL